MARHECDECGADVENKNAAGHYRSKCWQCICEAADSDAPTRWDDPR